jgi:hypothetical protein
MSVLNEGIAVLCMESKCGLMMKKNIIIVKKK